jgi:hypothetical protein
MKRILLSSFAMVCLLASSASYGQTKGRPSLGVGFEVGVPAGDLNATQKLGIGGTAKLALPVASGTSITLSSGYISFSGDEYQVAGATIKRPALNFIPIKAGLRYQFVPNGFYVEPQFGYTSIGTPNSNTSATGGFTYAANAGFLINNSWDLSARYEAVNRKGNNLPFLGFRLGYNFSL